MGIGTSSSSSGASAPRANAYAVNRDASELGRSRARKVPASAQPDPMHVIYMYVRRATRAADPADSHVQARTAPKTAARSTYGRRIPPPPGRPREHQPAGLSRTPGMPRHTTGIASPARRPSTPDALYTWSRVPERSRELII